MATFSGDGGQKSLFRNWVVATTSKSSRRGAGSETVEKPNFKQLLNMVKQSGATHSKIVHKRVKFLISTDDAYKFKTQSVRKAIKYGIPILHQAFLSTVLNTGIVPLNLENYVLRSSNGNDMSTYFAKISIKKSIQTKVLPLSDTEVKEKAELEHIDTEEEAENVDKDSKKVKKKKKKKKKEKQTNIRKMTCSDCDNFFIPKYTN